MAPRLAIRPVPRVILGLAAVTGLLAGSAPRTAHADPDGVVTESAAQEPLAAAPSVALDQYPPPSTRTKLFVAGAATTVAWYGLALGASLAWPDTVGAKDLRIPVAGPWVAFSHSGCGNVSDCHKAIVVLRAIATALDGIGQATGLGLAAEGLFLPTQEREQGPRRKRAELKRSFGVEWRPTFDAGKNTVSFGVLGVF